MSFNSFSSSLGKKFQELSTTVSQKTQEISTNLPNLAQSTQRLVQEKLGNVTDISQLPQEYIELEKKVDTIKLICEHFLQITTIYENESYDYPKYIKDSANEFSKIFTTKVQELSHASSATEAQNILISPNATTEPKTLNYALSKVALNSSELFNQLSSSALTPNDNKISSILLNFSNIQTKIAQERLKQDTLIQTKFNKQLRDELSTNIGRATKARKDVQNKRLQYDVARSNLLNAKPEKEASLRVQMEALEDEFAQVTENATFIMQEVLSNSKFLIDLNQLAQAQLNYFENSSNLMKDFIESNNFETSGENDKTSTTDKKTKLENSDKTGIQLDANDNDD